jgi:hypothetical protein
VLVSLAASLQAAVPGLPSKPAAPGGLGFGSAPQIVSAPQSGIVSVGSTVDLQVSATGTEPLQFQWFKDQSLIPDVTGPEFRIEGATFDDAGEYEVQVANRFGAQQATLTLTVAPIVRIVTTTAPAGIVDVPVELVAGGNENAIGFSVSLCQPH